MLYFNSADTYVKDTIFFRNFYNKINIYYYTVIKNCCIYEDCANTLHIAFITKPMFNQCK